MEDSSLRRKIETVTIKWFNHCLGYDERRPNQLCVENFQDISQDIGKGAFKISQVVNCFKQARDGLYYPAVYPIESYLEFFINIDEFIHKRALKLKL